MVVEWLCPGLRPAGSRRPRLLHCKVILLDEHELLQDVLVSLDQVSFLPLATDIFHDILSERKLALPQSNLIGILDSLFQFYEYLYFGNACFTCVS